MTTAKLHADGKMEKSVFFSFFCENLLTEGMWSRNKAVLLEKKRNSTIYANKAVWDRYLSINLNKYWPWAVTIKNQLMLASALKVWSENKQHCTVYVLQWNTANGINTALFCLQFRPQTSLEMIRILPLDAHLLEPFKHVSTEMNI